MPLAALLWALFIIVIWVALTGFYLHASWCVTSLTTNRFSVS